MTPILILIIFMSGVEMNVEQIPFRTMESCQSAAAQLERDLAEFNVRAICIDRRASASFAGAFFSRTTRTPSAPVKAALEAI